MNRSKRLYLLVIILLSAFMAFPSPVRADEDTQPPVIFVQLDKEVLTRTEFQAVYFSAYDPEPGSGLLATVAMFEGTMIQSGQNLTMLWLPLGQHSIQVFAYDLAGNVSSTEVTFELQASLESLRDSVQTFCGQGYITKATLCTAYVNKLDYMIEMRDAGRTSEVRSLLANLSIDIARQSTKTTNPAIIPAIAEILMGDITFIITHL